MAVTLLQYMSDTRADELSGSLVQMFNDFSPVFSEIPMSDNGEDLFFDYEQVKLLPATGWRAFNTPWAESTGVTVPYREYLKILGGEIKWDVQFANDKTITRQTEMKVQSSVKTWDASFFEGSPTVDVNSMIGLRARIGGNQLILNAASPGGPLTLAKLSALIDAVPFSTRQEQGMVRGQGIRKVLYMNRTLRNKIDLLISQQTGSLRIDTTKDAFGDMVEQYRDAVIRVVETTGDGSTTLGFDEDIGGGATTSSIYCVAYGEGLVEGLFRTRGGGKALDTFRKDQLESEPRGLIRFEGMYGFAISHPRAAARLYGVTAA